MANRVNSGGLPPNNVDLDSSQTLSNKTIDSSNTNQVLTLEEQSVAPSTPSAGDKKLYAKDNGSLFTLDSAGNEVEVGAGSGGTVRYIDESFENGVDSLVAYADAAGISPVDGTGGSPTLAVAAETAAPLVGDQSAKISKDAANRQGEGAAILSATVDEAYSDKVHTVELLWKTDANYVSGDMSLWVVHPTTGTVEALNFRTALGEYTNELPASDGTVTRIVSELTPIDSTYRIVLHVASTSATAYDVFVDNIQTGPQRTFNAPIVTEWESFTPTGSWTTGTTYTGKYRRVGDTLEANVLISADGAVTSSTLFLDIPLGLTVDTNKIEEGANTAVLADGSILNFGLTIFKASGFYDASAGQIRIDYHATPASEVNLFPVTQSAPFTFGANDEINLNVKVPIQGWDAGAAFSTTQVDQQTSTVSLSKSSNQSIADNTGVTVTFDGIDYDNSDFADLSNNRIEIKKAGTYRVTGSLGYAGAVGGVRFLALRVNGGRIAESLINGSNVTANSLNAAKTVELQQGDTVDLEAFQSSGSALDALSGRYTYLQVERIPDFSVFAATVDNSTTHVVKATTSGGQSFAANTETALNYETIEFDNTAGAVTGTTPFEYTALRDQKIYLNASIYYNSASLTGGSVADFRVKVNGSTAAIMGRLTSQVTASTLRNIYGSTVLELSEGDTVQVFGFHQFGSSGSVNANPDLNRLEIVEVGTIQTLNSSTTKNLVQTKILSADENSDRTIPDLTFNNLTIGKWYEVRAQWSLITDANSGSDGFVQAVARHDGTIIALSTHGVGEATDITADGHRQGMVFSFRATSTSLTFEGSSLSTNGIIVGDGTLAESWVQLEERNDLAETSKF